jgi:hypothetical protein
MKATKRITARHENMAVSVVVEMSIPIRRGAQTWEDASKTEAGHRADRMVDAIVRAVADGGRYYIQDVKVR